MNRPFTLASGALACALLALPALAQEYDYGNSRSHDSHPAAPPSRASGPSTPYRGNYAPPHYPSGGFQHQPAYTHEQYERTPSRPSWGERTTSSEHAPYSSERTYRDYRGGGTWQQDGHPSFSGRGYAPGSWAHNFDRDRMRTTYLRRSEFYNFRGRSVVALSVRDREMWRGGAWRHAWHNGRFGWWWYVNGGWFFYNAPVYPYPEYISDTIYYDDSDYGYDGYGPDLWYWCAYPQGYYPDVQMCMVPWQQVPAQY